MKTSFSAIFLVILVSGCALVQSHSQPGLYQRRHPQNLVNDKRTPENSSKTTSVKVPTTKTTPPATPPTKVPSTSAVPTKPPVTSAAPTSTTPTHVTTTPKPTPPHCTPGQKKPVTNSCRDYTECDKTYKWVKKSCSTWCHNFNPDSSKCVWSWQYHCVDPTKSPCTSDAPSSTAPPTTAAPTTVPTTAAPTSAKSSTTSTSPTPTISTSATTKGTTSAPECTKNGEMKVYKKGDCKDYLQCQSGQWVKQSCSWGYHFDINKLECRFSWWATC